VEKFISPIIAFTKIQIEVYKLTALIMKITELHKPLIISGDPLPLILNY